jgi:hypothetical protein
LKTTKSVKPVKVTTLESRSGKFKLPAVVYYLDSNTEFTNQYQVNMSQCHETLASAVEEMRVRQRIADRDKFRSSNNNYNTTQSRKSRILKDYPELVMRHLIDELKVDEDTALTPATLKISHYRLAMTEGGYDKLFKQITNIKFPDLVDGDDDGDE